MTPTLTTVTVRKVYYLVNTVTDVIDDEDLFSEDEVRQYNDHFRETDQHWRWLCRADATRYPDID